MLQQIGEDPARIEPVLTVKTNHLYIAFSKQTDEATVHRWEEALHAMREDGTFKSIYQKWLPGQKPPPDVAMSAADRAAMAKLRIVTEELPPLNYTEDGKVTGLSTEIVRELKRHLGVPRPIEVMPWSRAYRLAQEHANIALFSTVRSAPREALFQWVGPLGANHSVLYARRDFDGNVRSLEDARRIESIGTYKDDTDEQYLRLHDFTNLYSHGSPDAVVRNLMAGRIQLWAAGSLYAPLVMEKAGFSITQVKPVLSLRETQFYIAFSRDTPRQVVELWQHTFDELVRNGTVTPIRALAP